MNIKKQTKKKPISDKRKTLEYIHNEKLKYFENLQKQLPIKQKKLDSLIKKLNSLHNPLNDIDLKSQINSLQSDINKISSKEEEMDYYLQTQHIIMDFFSINTKEQVIDQKKEKSVLSFFGENTPKSNKVKLKDLVIVKENSKKKELYDQYLEIIGQSDYNPQKNKNLLICDSCLYPLEINHTDGITICPNCSATETYFGYDYTPGYKELQEMDITPHFPYKRINHFNEWLSKIQAKENTEIPDQVIKDILDEFAIRKINVESKSFDSLRDIMRSVLQKLDHTNHYEHIPHIIYILNKQQPLQMSPEEEHTLRIMFHEIQIPFEKWRRTVAPSRKNFLSYSYTIHKFCELQEFDGFLHYFPYLKDNQKLAEHDRIWKGICKDLKWEFIKSI